MRQSGPRDNPAASDEAGTVAAAPGPFVVTMEHRRFAEFADAVRRDRYIGLATGRPGSARPCPPGSTPDGTSWGFPRHSGPWTVPAPEQAMANRTIIYTPMVHITARIVEKEFTYCMSG